MSYRVQIHPSVARKLITWQLPDFALVEVYLRLRDRLRENPASQLRRARRPFEGMVYEFSFVDVENRLCEHHFVFHVVYGQDEETLLIANGGYKRQIGL